MDRSNTKMISYTFYYELKRFLNVVNTIKKPNRSNKRNADLKQEISNQ